MNLDTIEQWEEDIEKIWIKCHITFTNVLNVNAPIKTMKTEAMDDLLDERHTWEKI